MDRSPEALDALGHMTDREWLERYGRGATPSAVCLLRRKLGRERFRPSWHAAVIPLLGQVPDVELARRHAAEGATANAVRHLRQQRGIAPCEATRRFSEAGRAAAAATRQKRANRPLLAELDLSLLSTRSISELAQLWQRSASTLRKLRQRRGIARPPNRVLFGRPQRKGRKPSAQAEPWAALIARALRAGAEERRYTVGASLAPGDLIAHPTWGLGAVRSVAEGKAAVAFEDGDRRLAAGGES